MKIDEIRTYVVRHELSEAFGFSQWSYDPPEILPVEVAVFILCLQILISKTTIAFVKLTDELIQLLPAAELDIFLRPVGGDGEMISIMALFHV